MTLDSTAVITGQPVSSPPPPTSGPFPVIPVNPQPVIPTDPQPTASTDPLPTPTTAPQSTLTADQRFVSHIYNDLLHRPADAAGRAFWADQLNNGMSRSQLAADIEGTAEYHRDQVNSLFQLYLHRNADEAALDHMSAFLESGTNEDSLATTIVASDEYFALNAGSNGGFLEGLFHDALGRQIDPGAKAAFDQALAQGDARVQIAQIVLRSHEHHALAVQSIYSAILDRSAAAGDVAYWADSLDHGVTEEQVIASIAASTEYYDKS
jgi:hypothetical protein